MTPRMKFWVELEGDIVMSDWRIKFLETIERTGSISSAAESLEIPYRRLWAKMKEIEENLSVKLVEGRSGGAHGGGSSITPAARQLIDQYHAFRDGLENDVEERFAAAFSGGGPKQRQHQAPASTTSWRAASSIPGTRSNSKRYDVSAAEP